MPVNAVDLLPARSPVPVSLLLADALPSNPHTKTAFRNSFYYDPEQRVLFVRRERLQDVGDFMLLLLHTLAHIGSDQWDDRHIQFVSHFYKCLRVVCAELFWNRAGNAVSSVQKIEAPQSAIGAAGTLDAESKASAVNDVESNASKITKPNRSSTSRAVDEMVELTSASAGGSDVFAPHRLMHRLEQYSAFTHSAELSKHLLELEAAAGERDFQSEFKRSAEHGWDLMMGSGAILQVRTYLVP